jgi:hypothetical protein
MGLLDRLRGKPTLEDFAAQLIQGARKAGCTDEFVFDEGIIIQRRDGELVGQINPANMFRAYGQAPKAERPECLKGYVRVVVGTLREPPQDYELAKVDLCPRLWTRSTHEFHRLRRLAGVSETNAPELAAFPVGSHLQACLAYDWPDTVQTVSPDWLEKWVSRSTRLWRTRVPT